MNFDEFKSLLAGVPSPVILIEGVRAIPESDYPVARRFAIRMAQAFPAARFRSGNAPGSDQAFSEGIADIDAARLQVVLPYPNHRMSIRYPEAKYASPQELAEPALAAMLRKTGAVSAETARLLERREKTPSLKAKAQYLVRDTMKVTGFSDLFAKSHAALFYANLTDPFAGGTGHTIRVCIQEGVPYFLQDQWKQWFPLTAPSAPSRRLTRENKHGR